MEVVNAIGRRKAAVARVYRMHSGKGEYHRQRAWSYGCIFPSESLASVHRESSRCIILRVLTEEYDIKVSLEWRWGQRARQRASAFRLLPVRWSRLTNACKPNLL